VRRLQRKFRGHHILQELYQIMDQYIAMIHKR